MKKSNVNTKNAFELQHVISTIDKLQDSISDQGKDNDMTILLNLKRKYFSRKLRLLNYGSK